MLAAGDLGGIRLLVMAQPYYLTQDQADALDRWVRAGGVLLSDAHLAGYDGSTGRHCAVLPGCGLSERWGIREVESTSSRHLPRSAGPASDAAGGILFPVRMADGSTAWGAHRYAVLAGDAIQPLARFDEAGPCVARLAVGAGQVFYCGTNAAQAAAEGAPALLETLLRAAAGAARIAPTAGARAAEAETVHVDLLEDDGVATFAVVVSRATTVRRVHLSTRGTWRGVFTGTCWRFDGATEVDVPTRFVDLFAIEDGPRRPA
jgi:hypothetical protein